MYLEFSTSETRAPGLYTVIVVFATIMVQLSKAEQFQHGASRKAPQPLDSSSQLPREHGALPATTVHSERHITPSNDRCVVTSLASALLQCLFFEHFELQPLHLL